MERILVPKEERRAQKRVWGKKKRKKKKMKKKNSRSATTTAGTSHQQEAQGSGRSSTRRSASWFRERLARVIEIGEVFLFLGICLFLKIIFVCVSPLATSGKRAHENCVSGNGGVGEEPARQSPEVRSPSSSNVSVRKMMVSYCFDLFIYF
jgi:hypothetical protein